nr:hypothetical protein [Mycolicibacterium malmesburyense]CRL76786.1 hypothetical protein CPGR_04090 [Mycolicibacterium malmesburyense]
MTTSRTSIIDRTEQIRPAVPGGDDRHEASAVLNQVLARTEALHNELQAIVNRHGDNAPASSQHVLDLTSAIAGTVLDWIERWPS